MRCLWSAGLVAVAVAGANKTADTSLTVSGSDPRIIGGEEVDPAFSYPFLVGIAEVGYYCCQCGGSLISSEWVLTAAHCVEVGKAYTVLIYGHSSRLAPGENHRCTQQIAVLEVLCHEGYSDVTNEADICLLRLADAPTCADEMEAEVQFIRLDEGNSGRDSGGTAVTLAGWGLTSEDGTESPDLMRHVTTTMVDFDDCNNAYARTLVEGSMICAGEPEGGKDSCQGDSGGPLFLEEEGSFVQVGVVSFGVGCGRAEHPGVYASVAHYLPWINGKITGAPAPPASTGCENTCTYASDNECDDGGAGSEYRDCSLGTDCADCGSRAQGPICSNTCGHSVDGDCDDGGAGSEYSMCDFGSDCVDCGARGDSSSTPSPPPGTSTCPESSSRCASFCNLDNACSDCGCGGCPGCPAVVVSVVASGSVTDYDTSENMATLRSNFAQAAQVSTDKVTVSVAAGSVVITATIELGAESAEAIEFRMQTLFSSVGPSAALGVDVEGEPTFSREEEDSSSSDIWGLSFAIFIAVVLAAVVGLIGIVIVVTIIICCCCCCNKPSASNVSPAAPARAVPPPVAVAVPARHQGYGDPHNVPVVHGTVVHSQDV